MAVRVIAGSARGITLLSPKTDLRPTMDRVKSAIFSSLGESVRDTHVLDLFAGTGSLGIEALSRGAASATFVEKDALAVEAITRNLAKTKFAGDVRQLDIFAFLKRCAPHSFHIIFADPPYARAKGERDFGIELASSNDLANALAPGGVFVLEKLPGAPIPIEPLWQVARSKRYGATEVVVLRHAE